MNQNDADGRLNGHFQDECETNQFRAIRLANARLQPYTVCMANSPKVSSAPLFGASTPAQIREIQARIKSATAKHARSQESARAMLKKVGALRETGSKK